MFDFDNHEKDSYKNDDANTDDLWKSEVDSLRRICKLAGIDAEPIISENELCLPIGYIVDPAVLEKTEWKRKEQFSKDFISFQMHNF